MAYHLVPYIHLSLGSICSIRWSRDFPYMSGTQALTLPENMCIGLEEITSVPVRSSLHSLKEGMPSHLACT